MNGNNKCTDGCMDRKLGNAEYLLIVAPLTSWPVEVNALEALLPGIFLSGPGYLVMILRSDTARY
jgi:hypothetical protein